MSTREDYPAGVPCWVDTNQRDPAAAARFYSGLFGWETEDVMPPEAGAHYFMARIDGRDAAAISSLPPGAPPQTAWNTYVRVESADDAAAGVRGAGGQVLSEPFDVFESGRMGVFADPEGAVFCVWQPGSHRGSAAVNEHGAVNFNNLHTDDVEAAKTFYGAVFGWTTIAGGAPMWALPGYGDHLEELNPGMRAGMKEMGAPEGFENVVATILPRDGAPAHWSVDRDPLGWKDNRNDHADRGVRVRHRGRSRPGHHRSGRLGQQYRRRPRPSRGLGRRCGVRQDAGLGQHERARAAGLGVGRHGKLCCRAGRGLGGSR